MNFLELLVQWLIGTSQFIVGMVFGTILTGVFTWKVVMPKILANPKISRFLTTVEQLEDYAERIVRNQGSESI